MAIQLGYRDATPAQLRAAAIPVYAIGWNLHVLVAISTDVINNALARLRNSVSPKKDYERYASWLHLDYPSFFSFPPEFPPRRATAERFRFELSFGRGDILELCVFLSAKGPPSPGDLGRLSPVDIQPLIDACPAPQLLRSFSTAARVNQSDGSPADMLIPDHAVFSQEDPVKEAMAHGSQFPRSGSTSLRSSNKLKLPSSFARVGPAQRIKQLKSTAVLPRLVGR